MTAGGALETERPIQAFENSPSTVNVERAGIFITHYC
jgi:hypothetical protein